MSATSSPSPPTSKRPSTRSPGRSATWFSSGALPIIIGGDHSIGFPCVRGIAQCTSKRIGIVHFDRHIDIQEKDLDERMHTTPWFHATNLANVPAVNLVQVGIGGWQVPREGVKVARKRNTNIFTMRDIEEMGLAKTAAEMALETGLEGCRRGLYLL
jgi:agmatinase